MRTLLVLTAAVAIALAGCGKSADQKKLESDLNAAINKAHEDEMASMKVLDSLASAVDAATAQHNELAAKYAKLATGHTADDLTSALDKIASAKKTMQEWMKAYRPYDENAPHEEAMAKLNKDMQDLMAVKTQMDEAMKSASTAVTAHTKFADELLAKVAKKK